MKKDKILSEAIGYAKHIEANNQTMAWIEHNLSNYLDKNEPKTEEIEHIIDYLAQSTIKQMDRVTYEQAKNKSELWVKKLQSEAEKIKETKDDVEVIHDFKDGFKIVKLVGRNAYLREGKLMRNCVASYYGKDIEIYSLRDKFNKPHCTMEKDQQIKGKGNGDIHPKYVKYIIKFLELSGMTVGDDEMKHLGYINVDKYKKELSPDNKLFNKKYWWYKGNKLIGKDGKEFASLDMLDDIPIIDETTLKINFDLKTFIPLSLNFLFRKLETIKSKLIGSSGNYAQIGSSGYSAKIGSSGDSAKIGSSGDYAKIGSSGDYAKIGSSGDSAKIGSSGCYARIGSSGKYAQIGSSGYSARIYVKGKNSVCSNIGYDGIVKGVIGTWLTLAEYDKDGIVKFVKTEQVDGKKILPNVWYILKDKKFTEAE
jgi:hypothetical protein